MSASRLSPAPEVGPGTEPVELLVPQPADSLYACAQSLTNPPISLLGRLSLLWQSLQKLFIELHTFLVLCKQPNRNAKDDECQPTIKK